MAGDATLHSGREQPPTAAPMTRTHSCCCMHDTYSLIRLDLRRYNAAGSGTALIGIIIILCCNVSGRLREGLSLLSSSTLRQGRRGAAGTARDVHCSRSKREVKRAQITCA